MPKRSQIQRQFKEILLVLQKNHQGYQWFDLSNTKHQAKTLRECQAWLSNYIEALPEFARQQEVSSSATDSEKLKAALAHEKIGGTSPNPTQKRFHQIQEKAASEGFKLSAWLDDNSFKLEYGTVSAVHLGSLDQVEAEIRHLAAIYNPTPQPAPFYIVTHNFEKIEVSFSTPIPPPLTHALKQDNFLISGAIATRPFNTSTVGEYSWLRNPEHWISKYGYQLEQQVGYHPRSKNQNRGLALIIDYQSTVEENTTILIREIQGKGFQFKLEALERNWEYNSPIDEYYESMGLAEKQAIDYLQQDDPPHEEALKILAQKRARQQTAHGIHFDD